MVVTPFFAAKCCCYFVGFLMLFVVRNGCGRLLRLFPAAGPTLASRPLPPGDAPAPAAREWSGLVRLGLHPAAAGRPGPRREPGNRTRRQRRNPSMPMAEIKYQLKIVFNVYQMWFMVTFHIKFSRLSCGISNKWFFYPLFFYILSLK
jgi:hypothetical protein